MFKKRNKMHYFKVNVLNMEVFISEKDLVYNKYLRSLYLCIDAYIEVRDVENWKECPICELKPLVWRFNNGNSTACGCGSSIYNHFSIRSESIMSHIKRHNGSAASYNSNELCDNWNEYATTGKIVFDYKKEYEKNGKW
jgi:hypothetical protein